MRFLALVRKELRECLPGMMLAAVSLLVLGGFALWVRVLPENAYRYPFFSPGSTVSPRQLTRHSVLGGAGLVLLMISIAFGLALAVRQFWMPFFTRTWPFLIHRSVQKSTILWAKFATGTAALLVSLGPVWLGLYLYAGRPEVLAVPPTLRVFWEGWFYIASGLIAYLGAVLVGLGTAKWYTTRIFGLAFATLIVITTLVQCRLSLAFASVAVGAVVLLSQIMDTFLNREF
jgi:hypothetical protein